MKKQKLTILFVMLLTAINSLQAQVEYDIYDLESTTYQMYVTSGNDYTTAINNAIQDVKDNGGGVILLPGNKTIEITSSIFIGTSAPNLADNITFKSSHSTAIIKCSDNFNGTSMISLGNRQNITFEGIKFDANKKAIGISVYGTSSSNINITNCTFEDAGDTDEYFSGIQIQNVTDVNIKNCVFRGGFLGISLSGNNTRIYIENNTFESTLDNSPIRIYGTQSGNFSNHVWIRGNDMRIGRSVSIIDELDQLTRNESGAVLGLNTVNGGQNVDYSNWIGGNTKGHYAIDITCGSPVGEIGTTFHENIVIENNIAIGPDYGFFDGGSADLYGLKDIVRLKCANNVARNSGDLGFAIVNCSGAIVSGNTADRNNSAGIGIFETRNSVFTANILENNGLRRDYLYNGTPYGGILITGGNSYNNLIEGNHFFGYADIDVSLPIDEIILPGIEDYTKRDSPTDYYGIVIRPNFFDIGSGGGINYSASPFSNKIGNNHYAGLKWGPIYNPIPSTQISDNFSATTFPKNQDFPLGTWIRNSNLNNSALGWSVINRVETSLHAVSADLNIGNWTVGDSIIKVKDDTNTIQVGDIFGIKLDDGNIHWSEITSLTPQFGYYDVKLVQYPTVNITNDGLQDPAAKLFVNSADEVAHLGMGRIVILRWLTVTK